MHHLQTKILYALAIEDGLKFSALKPKNMESNQFMYHLKSVMAQGYVKKNDSVYQLTPKGLRYVSALSFELLSTRMQPVIKTMIYAENDQGQQLLYRFNRQPLRGRTGLVTGKIHYGETELEAAERELMEKSGLTAKLEYIGQVNTRTYKENELVTHTLYFIFKAEKASGKLTKSDLHGESFWGKVDDYQDAQLMPGLSTIMKQIKNHKSIFFEELSTKL